MKMKEGLAGVEMRGVGIEGVVGGESSKIHDIVAWNFQRVIF